MGGDMDTCLFNKRLTEISFLGFYSNYFRLRRTQGAGYPRLKISTKKNERCRAKK
jgi:hypothetical protein